MISFKNLVLYLLIAYLGFSLKLSHKDNNNSTQLYDRSRKKC